MYQIEGLAGFSAVVDRLGQFVEATEASASASAAASAAGAAAATEAAASASTAAAAGGAAAAVAAGVGGEAAASAGPAAAANHTGVRIVHLPSSSSVCAPLLELRGLCVLTPDGGTRLAQGLDLKVRRRR